jgi:hypothetical protein
MVPDHIGVTNMATRHQRRKAAKAIREAKAREAIVQANLSNPQAKRPVSKIAAGYAQATGFASDRMIGNGLHRNNQVPRKHRTVALMTTHEREAIARLRVAPFYREGMKIVAVKGDAPAEKATLPTHRTKRGTLKWNLDSFVDNRALRTVTKK